MPKATAHGPVWRHVYGVDHRCQATPPRSTPVHALALTPKYLLKMAELIGALEQKAMEGAADFMAAQTRKRSAAEMFTGARYDELYRMLVERRREILNEVRCKVRDVRAEGSERDHEVHDAAETSEVEIQEDIEFALIQMKTETVNKINEALSRLKEGTYGLCFECGEEIAQLRLRALPFAVRCKGCEEAREIVKRRERIHARRGSSGLGFELRG